MLSPATGAIDLRDVPPRGPNAAERAALRLEAGDVAGSLDELQLLEPDQLAADAHGPSGAHLLDALATVYARLRLPERMEQVRALAETALDSWSATQQATHWAHWAGDLAGQAMEPRAAGRGEPAPLLLTRAAQIAERVTVLPADEVPQGMRRAANGVRALAAGYAGRYGEALRLLGRDGVEAPADLPAPARDLTLLAAVQAHALAENLEAARRLDDAGGPARDAPADLILQVCRARERLALELRHGGDTTGVRRRLDHLVTRLAWCGLEAAGQASRRALSGPVPPRAGAGQDGREHLAEELRRMLQSGDLLPLSLVLVDVRDPDGTDRADGTGSDAVLRRIATTLPKQAQSQGRLVRYGAGFAVVLPRTAEGEAEAAGERMAHAVRGEDAVRVRTGWATARSTGRRGPQGAARRLLRQADERLLTTRASWAPDPAGRGPVGNGSHRRVRVIDIRG